MPVFGECLKLIKKLEYKPKRTISRGLLYELKRNGFARSHRVRRSIQNCKSLKSRLHVLSLIEEAFTPRGFSR